MLGPMTAAHDLSRLGWTAHQASKHQTHHTQTQNELARQAAVGEAPHAAGTVPPGAAGAAGGSEHPASGAAATALLAHVAGLYAGAKAWHDPLRAGLERVLAARTAAGGGPEAAGAGGGGDRRSPAPAAASSAAHRNGTSLSGT